MDKFFKISERGSNVKTEIIAGLTTFFAMAYIVITNPNQITSFSTDGALGQIWNAVYVASILVAVIGTLLMALYAKMPFAQACGMGLNSFFFVSFILPAMISGGDLIAGYQAGLVIILVSGIVFLIFSITKLRSKVAKALPECLKKAIPAGIGLFIAFIGFQNVGIIQANQYTLVQFNDFHGAIANGEFLTASLPALLALLGLIVIAVLEKLKVKGSVLITIAGIAVLYYIITGTMPSISVRSVRPSRTSVPLVSPVCSRLPLGRMLSPAPQLAVFCLPLCWSSPSAWLICLTPSALCTAPLLKPTCWTRTAILSMWISA